MDATLLVIGLCRWKRCTIRVMKIIAIDGSPHGEQGNTALLLDQFIQGARGAGGEVEKVSVTALHAKTCCGRMVCWYRTPGVCIHADDVTELVDRMAWADVWVLSTPVHVGGMTEQMVRVMERTVRLLSPCFEIHDSRTRHVASPHASEKMVVLISTCGYYEDVAFSPLVSQVEDLSWSHHRRFAGALLRPHGLALRYMQAHGMEVREVLDAARYAGVEIVRDGVMSERTLDAVRQPLLTQEEFVLMMNSAFERRMGCQADRTPGCNAEGLG